LVRQLKIIAPSMQLGVTPIVPPKKTRQEKPNAGTENVVRSAIVSHKIKDSTLLTVAKSHSPDSVASLNEGRKLFLSHKKKSGNDEYLSTHPEMMEVEGCDNQRDPSELFLGHESEEGFDNESNTSSLQSSEPQAPVEYGQNDYKELSCDDEGKVEGDNMSLLKCCDNGRPGELQDKQELNSITLLSSESFLENFTEVISELASGRWTKALAPNEQHKIQTLASTRVSICDCPLVDIAGVDVELSDKGGIIVHRLSNWIDGDQGIQQTSRSFIRELVLLAASGRYKFLHVILCVDIDITSAFTSEMVTLQNALVQQSGCHCDQVTFEFVKPRVLPATLALHLISNQTQTCGIADFISDENTMERARFLMMLVPSMPVHVALRCLGCSGDQHPPTNSGKMMYDLLHSAKSMRRNDFVESAKSILSDTSSHQLWLAMHVDLSHAH
jgi:hypothetical protein